MLQWRSSRGKRMRKSVAVYYICFVCGLLFSWIHIYFAYKNAKMKSHSTKARTHSTRQHSPSYLANFKKKYKMKASRAAHEPQPKEQIHNVCWGIFFSFVLLCSKLNWFLHSTICGHSRLYLSACALSCWCWFYLLIVQQTDTKRKGKPNKNSRYDPDLRLFSSTIGFHLNIQYAAADRHYTHTHTQLALSWVPNW